MKKLSTSEFVAKAREVHGDTYDYTSVVYTGSASKVTITCRVHGVFEQIARNHIGGQKSGCPKCVGKGVDWVERFKSVHGDLYDYSKVEYVDYKQPVVIGCSLHGDFLQTPDNHYRNAHGCPKCKGQAIRKAKQMTIEEFVVRANKVHQGQYGYEPVQFTNMLTGVVRVFCKTHAVWFSQNPVNHLAGKVGCPRCNNMKSAPEDEVAAFLNIFTPVQRRDRTIVSPMELDIVLPDYKLAIEYCGEYYHSHGDQESEAKDSTKHLRKYQAAKGAGYRLITLFGEEWQKRKPAIKRLLRNAIGKMHGKLMARKCELRQVTNAEASDFYDKYHPQGGAGYGDHYGLYIRDRLVACMRFTLGSNDRGVNRQRVWTLSRYATRLPVQGGASRLFKAFVADKKPTEVKSFSDNRFFEGGMYSVLGFELRAESGADYMVWHQRLGTKPKSHWQRRAIQERATQLGVTLDFDPESDPRTERDMTYLLGARRIYDCGKKTWVWTQPKKPDRVVNT